MTQSFSPAAKSAAAERAQIATAIATLETFGAEISGRIHDLGGNRQGLGKSGQMDCIDESINTSTYLLLFEESRLLRWHRYVGRIARGLPQLTWPHYSALIEEKPGKQRYVVDAWFHDNGQPPEIVPLTQWMGGWRPEQTRQKAPHDSTY